jgi:asparagine synthase (glutamine-hydrolysing)
MRDILPTEIVDRRDKMGFPVPLAEWAKDELRGFLLDVFSSDNARGRPYLAGGLDVRDLIAAESSFGRNLWALFSLELWQQTFHDRAAEWHSLQARAEPSSATVS